MKKAILELESEISKLQSLVNQSRSYLLEHQVDEKHIPPELDVLPSNNDVADRMSLGTIPHIRAEMIARYNAIHRSTHYPGQAFETDSAGRILRTNRPPDSSSPPMRMKSSPEGMSSILLHFMTKLIEFTQTTPRIS